MACIGFSKIWKKNIEIFIFFFEDDDDDDDDNNNNFLFK